jgi:metallo-beta-lactamase family protein
MRQEKPPIEPQYSVEEVEALSSHFQALPYGQAREIADGMTLRFSDAGHILGSASVELDGNGPAGSWVVIFSGDVGPRAVPFLCDPVPPSPNDGPDMVILESTYGDRDHWPLDQTLSELRQILLAAVEHGEKVLIPPSRSAARNRSSIISRSSSSAESSRSFPSTSTRPWGSRRWRFIDRTKGV